MEQRINVVFAEVYEDGHWEKAEMVLEVPLVEDTDATQGEIQDDLQTNYYAKYPNRVGEVIALGIIDNWECDEEGGRLPDDDNENADNEDDAGTCSICGEFFGHAPGCPHDNEEDYF